MTVSLRKNEIVGPVRQDSFVDPLSKSNYEHKGPTIEEELEKGKVGVYEYLF